MREFDEVAAAVTYNPVKQKFLLLKRADERERFAGKWEFPSGFIEEGETEEDAALRELEEETGLKGEFVRKGESFPIEIPKVHIHPVLVTVEGEEVELSQEHDDFQWAERSDLEVLDTVPKLKQDLEKVGIG